jgi:hypothetical protein
MVRPRATLNVVLGTALALSTYSLVALAAASAKTSDNPHLGGQPVPTFQTARISPAQFKALHRAVGPSGEAERWTEIPWETDLAAARAKSTQTGKPLLMWIMDGHPLGCT